MIGMIFLKRMPSSQAYCLRMLSNEPPSTNDNKHLFINHPYNQLSFDSLEAAKENLKKLNINKAYFFLTSLENIPDELKNLNDCMPIELKL